MLLSFGLNTPVFADEITDYKTDCKNGYSVSCFNV